MRFSIVLLTCCVLFACGKTGALYLPEEPATRPEQGTKTQPQDTQVQNEQDQSQDAGADGNTD